MLTPAVDRDARRAQGIEAHVESQDDSLRAEVLEPRSHEIDAGNGGAADHGAADAGVQHLRQGQRIAQAATHLQRHRALSCQFENDFAIAVVAVPSTVQIDDVQPVGAIAAILGEQRTRIGVVAGFGLEVASQQPHAMAVLQVERRDEAHQAIARKFCSIRAPTAAERSGWNCAPKKLRHSTQAEKDEPYCVLATVALVTGSA